MVPRRSRPLSRLAVACVVGLLWFGTSSGAAATNLPTAATAVSTVPPVDTTNPFLPQDANLGDCLSSLPRPDCGSAARGGFAQWSVLVVLVAGLAFIGWRVVRGARRNAAAAAGRLGTPTPGEPTP